MRRFTLLAMVVVVVLLGAGLAAGAGLAVYGPFRPGEILFPIQNYCEQQFVRFKGDPPANVRWYFELADRRLENLESTLGSEHEYMALQAFNRALDQIIQAIAGLPAGQVEFYARLLALIDRADQVLLAMQQQSVNNATARIALQAKLATLRLMISGSQVADGQDGLLADFQFNLPGLDEIALTEDGMVAIDPRLVPFPSDSPAGQHTFFPLVGEHFFLECEVCHADGIYQGTPNTCVGCHAGQTPQNHFSGECGRCHTPFSWAEVFFDHNLAAAADCLSCHIEDRPLNHYSGQCSACHSSSGWSGASFNHSGYTDCQGCHESDRPSGHYSGQCSACHSSGGWDDATFSHSGFTDCLSCHLQDRPKEHSTAQCSECHNTSDWDDDEGGDSERQGISGQTVFDAYTSPGLRVIPWHGVDCGSCHAAVE